MLYWTGVLADTKMTHGNYIRTPEIRKKQSESAKLRKPFSEDTRKKMSDSHKGVKNHNYGKSLPEETRMKMRGRIVSTETRKKLSDINKGKHIPEETRKKIVDATIGEKNHFFGKSHSIESRKKMSDAQKGHIASEETRKKLSIIHKNISGETREKMRTSHIGERNYFFGKHHNEDTKAIIKDHRRFQITTIESRKKMSVARKGKKFSDEHRIKISENGLGGHWYGNVRYGYKVECELWKDVNPRVHAWFDYKCVLCEEPENGKSHIGHHVFYETKACCMTSEDGKYYTNLNAPKHPIKDYYIGENPNYFVILCPSCHGKTGGRFENRKKYADELRGIIDTYYEGKCYFTTEEWNVIRLANP